MSDRQTSDRHVCVRAVAQVGDVRYKLDFAFPQGSQIPGVTGENVEFVLPISLLQYRRRPLDGLTAAEGGQMWSDTHTHTHTHTGKSLV